MPAALASVELRSLVASHIAAAFIERYPPTAPVPEQTMKDIAQAAVKMAKEIEAAAATSLKP